ncbi:oligosaccharyl transferase, archaeosortase A system-associated [Halomarina oriensis]|uniref:dolichyl-phosphooligosaccharide-protein glycotransferase n=1 Tax=Halomarina oriensis TaxID=671145 RepID=A0A6B0GLW2_9EURY|nr:oligosaccharyl transferase, archaeosortase A system-associated [Halomarina oriensis]MWG35714.1 oligosaccharyl transferase, archaeosortase A system-associated [Halomarina oriensis]
MSQPTEREDGLTFDADSVLGRVRELYHIPAVALLLAFMLWNRVKTWENFSSNGEFLFRGNDAWYHLRQTSYTVQNFPFTMPFDPWTNFPTGTASGQFGTLFDQLVALGALVLGLFMPQDQATTMALLFAPAVLGTLVAIPAYFIARRFGGKLGGVIAVLVLALTPGAFLFRSLVGFSDHHIAEVLFQVLAVLGVMVAVSVAQRDLPVYEQFRAREWGTLRSTVVYSVLAGVALGLYVWVWPPAVFFVSVLGLFFLVHAVFVFLKGHSPEHVAIAGIVMSLVAALLSAVKVSEFAFSASDFSLLQPVAFLGLAVGLAAIVGLSRAVEGRSDASTVFPGAIVGAIALVALVAWLAVPDTFGYFVDQFLRVYGLDANAQVRTVNEARPIPLEQAGEFFAARYGFTFFVAVVVAVGALALYLLDDDPRGEVLLLVTWFVLMVLATLTQNRFEYYLAVPVATLTALGVGVVATRLQSSTGTGDGISAAQVMVVFTVVLVVVAPFVAVSGPLTEGIPLQSAQSAQSNGPGEVTQWDGSLEWLANSTPDEGQYGTENADNAPMEYYGTFERTADYEYGPGTYGVMSWWDYGHFITVEGDRIPNANPFQQGSNEAANFLLAQNESAATDVLTTDGDGDGEGGRYVMIDWKLADPRSQKYTAPTAFGDHGISASGPGENALIETLTYQQYFQGTQPQPQVYIRNQAHYDSMRTRLYQFHGSAASPRTNGQVVVVDWQREAFTVNGQQTQPYPQNASIKRFPTMADAQEYVETDTTAQIGGLQGVPTEYVPALEQYRLVHASEEANQVGPWVKTFERVDGATIEGTGPANATVTASVQMRIPTQNGTQFERFTYYQQVQTGEDGSFTMTVPYSTTGYDEFGPENGHTNVSVRSTGQYRLSAVTQGEDLSRTIYGANATVTEGQVLGEDDAATQVTLEEERTVQAGGNQSGNGTNVTASPDGGNETTGDSASNDTNASGNGTNTSGNGSANASTLAAPETVVARVA